MNGAHLHLMLVHFPIAGTLLSVPLLLAAWWMRNETVKRVGLALVVLMGVAAWVAAETGGWAAGVALQLPDITRDSIHEHAQAADWAVRALGLNGLLAAYGLFCAWKKKGIPQWLFVTVTVLAVWGSTVVARVGYLGGQIHHPETRPDFTVPAPDAASAPR